MNKCPMCQDGKITTLRCPGAIVFVMACDWCHGQGEITDEYLRAIEVGKRARADRLACGLSQREEAEWLGVDWIAYSKLENGRMVDTSPRPE